MTEETKKSRYYGVLILEGGVKFKFENIFDCQEDVPEWMIDIENFDLPTADCIWADLEGVPEMHVIPTKKILAYYLESCEV